MLHSATDILEVGFLGHAAVLNWLWGTRHAVICQSWFNKRRIAFGCAKCLKKCSNFSGTF